MILRPIGIVRLSYVRLGVEAAKVATLRGFYREVLGMLEDERSTDARAYFRCWREAHPFSLIVEERKSPSLIEIAFEVGDESDLETLAERSRRMGAIVQLSAGEDELTPVGRSVLVHIPDGPVVRLHGSLLRSSQFSVGHNSPDWVTPRSLRAAPAPLFLNHVGVTVPNVRAMVDFLCSALGFVVSERIESNEDGRWKSALLFRMSKDVGGQELALFEGPPAGLHHIAFAKEDCNDILLDGQFLAERRVRIDPLGPTRQLYGDTYSLHFYDPCDIRLELCSGGRLTEPHPEWQPVVWTESHLELALAFHDRQLSPGFLDACL